MSGLKRRLDRLEAQQPPEEPQRAEIPYRVLLEAREAVRRKPERVTPEEAAAIEEEIARREREGRTDD